MLSPWWGGDDWGDALRCFVDPITCTRNNKDTKGSSQSAAPPPGQTHHLLFLNFSLMTMTKSPLDLLRGGLVLMSCSSLTWLHGVEASSGAFRGASWSSSCSSPGHAVGHGITFTSMKGAKTVDVPVLAALLNVPPEGRKNNLKAKADGSHTHHSYRILLPFLGAERLHKDGLQIHETLQ